MDHIQKWQHKFEIRPGKWVFHPSLIGRKIGREIQSEVRSRWKPPPYYFHLRKGGHVSALKRHLNSDYFSILDLKNFYGSINRSRITRVLKPFIGYTKARDYALSSTAANPVLGEKGFILPFGFIQSPLLASLCLNKSALGIKLDQLHKESDIIITVFMDDIVISSNDQTKLIETSQALKIYARKSGWILNQAKEAIALSQIQAFNTLLSKNCIEITPERFAKFRDAYTASLIPEQREGIQRYIAALNQVQASQL